MPIYGNTCIYILIYKVVKSNDGSIFGRTSILKTSLMFVMCRRGRLTAVFIRVITWLIMISHFLRTSSYNKSNLHISLIVKTAYPAQYHQSPHPLPLCVQYDISISNHHVIQSSTYYWTLITVLSFCWRMSRLFSVTWYPLIFQVW